MGIFNQFKYKMKSALSVYTPRIYIVQAKIQSNHKLFKKCLKSLDRGLKLPIFWSK